MRFGKINMLTVEEFLGEPIQPTGKRTKFAVCFSGCKGKPYKTEDHKGAIIDTKSDFCPGCRNALFWVTERK